VSLRFHSVVIVARDVRSLGAFYRNVLEQQVEFDLGNCIIFKGGLSLWQLDPGYPIVKYRQIGFDKAGNRNLELCFETDEFETLVNDIQKYELSYLHPVVTEKWGQQTLRFYDPEDNLIEIGESMPCFVRRLAGQGLSLKALAEKTGLSLATVRTYLQETVK